MAESDAYAKVLDELCADPQVKPARMMGRPSIQLGKKMFGGYFDGDLVVRIGRERAGELIGSGRASPFDPSGLDRPMKDWARVPEPSDDWLALAEEAKAFLAVG
jgi:TfoX/Sxy family transcriptional regulator of competence genes